ncbi:hypothetical protein L484_027228 [Morus notabilis]|uniref:Uncharacterized protein n=1 Tax=Morus notabilis TaxID=981085 RepID=W9S1B1_9ROSA|nr:hypothetical protein L484_027228 [Morus notabilis]
MQSGRPVKNNRARKTRGISLKTYKSESKSRYLKENPLDLSSKYLGDYRQLLTGNWPIYNSTVTGSCPPVTTANTGSCPPGTYGYLS